MTTTPAIAARDQPVRTAAAMLVTVGVLALVGGGLALNVLAARGQQPSVARGAPAGGAWDAAASFGPVSVERVERFTGAPDAGGHGHAATGSDRIRVSLTLTNRRRAAVPFSPGQFRLRLDGAGTSVPAARPNPPPGSLAAGQTLHQRLSFLVPSSRTTFTLVFDDVGRATSLPIELGALPVESKG